MCDLAASKVLPVLAEDPDTDLVGESGVAVIDKFIAALADDRRRNRSEAQNKYQNEEREFQATERSGFHETSSLRFSPCEVGIVGAGTLPRYASGRHGYTVEDARRVFRGCPVVRVTEIRMGGIERLAPAGVLAPAEILSERVSI